VPPEVFICHSATDKPAADQVCAALEAEGVKCWIAPRDVRAGAVWAEAITEAIDASKVMVILISTDTIRSQRQVIREIELADARNTALLPLFIESVTLSKALEYYLKNRQWIDASTPPLERHMPSLVTAVRELLTGEVRQVPPPQKESEPPQRRSWKWLAIGTAAPLIVAFAILAYKGCFSPGRENNVVKVAPTPAVTPTPTIAPTVGRSNDNKPAASPSVTVTPTVTPTVAPTLAAPETKEPKCGTVFAWSNPSLDFEWSEVKGKSTYTLEFDCFKCASHPSGWYSELGRPWMLREGFGLRSPIYRKGDVYDRLKRERALAFRWRVWAVDSESVNGRKSAWCQVAFAGNLQR
jgi:TIR domain